MSATSGSYMSASNLAGSCSRRAAAQRHPRREHPGPGWSVYVWPRGRSQASDGELVAGRLADPDGHQPRLMPARAPQPKNEIITPVTVEIA